MRDAIKYDQKGPVVMISLNRPDFGNRITAEMIVTLTDEVRRVPNDAKLIMIRAEGSDFCEGRDYGAAPEDARVGKKPTTLEICESMTAPIIDFYSAIKNTPVPTLSVVQGVAAGFGCALACACDIVLAGNDAKFSLPEMHERGLPPSLAMTALIDRINLRTLVYLVYATQPIDAPSALAAGLVSAIEPNHLLQQKSDTLAAHICTQPADSIRAVKNYLKLAPQMEPAGRAALGSSLYAIVAGSR